jgi:outer membrane immunogenic protein
MKRVALISIAAMGVGFVHGAEAADLGVRAAPVVAPAPMVVAPTWTGLYAGVNGGYGWTSNLNASSTFVDPTGATVITPATTGLNATGAVFGGQLGYNWQAANWVFGVEGDFDGASIEKFNNASATVVTAGFNINEPFHTNVNWLASIRGRLGYVWGPGMIYATGGGAWANVDFDAGGPGNDSALTSTSTKSGWVVGAGYEWLINPNWSLRGEYLYYKFTDVANATVAGGAIVPGTFTTHNLGDMSINVFRVAVNYKFDWCR